MEHTDAGNAGSIELTRLGPVHLWWSEYTDAAVIGPADGAWGGENVYRCDACPDWQGDGEDAFYAHCVVHGYYARTYTGNAAWA